MMNDVIASFMNPSSARMNEPFEFLFNRHFSSSVTFRQFDPFTNGYMTSFLLALLSIAVNESPKHDADGFVIDDVLFIVLPNNTGVKTVSLLKNNGKSLMLVQNFFYGSDMTNIEDSGLSLSERESIGLLSKHYSEEKLMEFSVYDLNENWTMIEKCEDMANKIIHPFMEKLMDVPRIEQDAENVVKKVLSLKRLFKLPNGFHDPKYEQLDNRQIRLLWSHIKKNKHICSFLSENADCKIAARGFIHGVLFATYASHRTNVRISMDARNAHMMLEPMISLRNMKQFTGPSWIDIAGNSRPQRVDLNMVTEVLTMAEELLLTKDDDIDRKRHDMEQYVSQQLDRIMVPEFTCKDSAFLKAYLLGMITSRQSHELSYDICFPVDQSISDIIIQVTGRFLLLLNFGPPILENQIEQKLGLFKNELNNMGAVVMTISEQSSQCNPRIMREIVYSHGVTIELSRNKRVPYGMNYTQYNRKNHLVDLVERMVSLHTSNGNAEESLYPHLRHYFAFMGNILKFREENFQFFIQGTFHNSRLLPQGSSKVDKFYSKAAYVIRFETLGRITQINLFRATYMRQYESFIMKTNIREMQNYRIFNVFYDYNKTSNNFVISSLEGNDFMHSSFHISCSSVTLTAEECSKSAIKVHQHTFPIANNFFLPDVYRIQFIALDENTQSANSERRKGSKVFYHKWRNAEFDSSLTEWGLLTDNLEDSFYLLSTFIDEIVDNVKSIPGIKLPGAEFKLAWKVTKLESQWLRATGTAISKVASKVVPMVAVAMEAELLYSSVRDMVSGNANARTIFNAATATIGLSLATLDAGLAMGLLAGTFPNLLNPLSWTIVAVGAAVYLVNRMWDAYDEINQLQKLVVMNGGEYLYEFFRRVFFMGISDYHTGIEHEKKANNVRLEYGIELLKKSKDIQHFISSGSCYDTKNSIYYICKNVFIDLRSQIHTSVDKSDPDIKMIDKQYYKHFCHMAKSYRHKKSTGMILFSIFTQLFSHKGSDTKLSFICQNAFGISKVTQPASPISFFSLDCEKCKVYALNDTFNIFSLLKGSYCSLQGGAKGNNFRFFSVFRNCSIYGYEKSDNSVDFSQLDEDEEFSFVAKENNIIQFIEDENSTVLGEIHMQNIDTVIYGRPNSSDFFEASCFLNTVKIYCQESSEDVQHELYIPQQDNCNYSMKVKISGNAVITNEAIYGQFVYVSNKLKGNISLSLQGSDHSTHKYVASFVDINSIEDFIFDENSTSINIKICYMNYEINIFVSEPKSLEITFTGNITFQYDNGLYHLVIFSPNTKGQLWIGYRMAMELFSRRNIPIRVYSERDQETFAHHNGKILIDNVEMNFSMPPNDLFWAHEPQFDCKDGYNVFVFHPFCYPSQKPKIEGISPELLTCFPSSLINIDEVFGVLILDMTHITYSTDLKDKFYNITIEPELMNDTLILKFLGGRSDTNMTFYSWEIGNITLKGIMVNDQYKKVKIMTKSDFMLNVSDNGVVKVNPLSKEVCPFSHLVILDYHVIEHGQTFVFKDRLPTFFDLIRFSSSLVITNLAHSIPESLIIVDPTVRSTTIIINNFFRDTRMQTLKLQFHTENHYLDLAQWQNLPIESYEAWMEKLDIFNDYLNEDGFLLHYDYRFGTGLEYVTLED